MQEGWLKQGMLKEFSSEKFLESGSSEAYKEDGRKTLRWISRRWTARMEGNWLKIVIKWSVMLEVLNFPIILPVIFSCTNTNDWLTDWLTVGITKQGWKDVFHWSTYIFHLSYLRFLIPHWPWLSLIADTNQFLQSHSRYRYHWKESEYIYPYILKNRKMFEMKIIDLNEIQIRVM